ncbi:helix-turn-helix domain-containing protein [Dyadobacter subterraneus]|uniref:Helix-turn-helix transcriptional regulator n=1 Tax=Dyadobacter subterraneus TaxID=2773304 RepID=A0ABR9WJ17_9BACT|nr:helix-turn-helix transcriptional regulator [Dyadobacter subterraneus]MBE9465502.1 helix-turn-helix transcriptional regulator [Dyadobacter subterraneus]
MKDQENIAGIDQYVIDFIRRLRSERSLLQEDIAGILGTTKAFISNAESNNHRAKYNLRHIDKLASHFNLSPKDFLPEKSLQSK